MNERIMANPKLEINFESVQFLWILESKFEKKMCIKSHSKTRDLSQEVRIKLGNLERMTECEFQEKKDKAQLRNILIIIAITLHEKLVKNSLTKTTKVEFALYYLLFISFSKIFGKLMVFKKGIQS